MGRLLRVDDADSLGIDKRVGRYQRDTVGSVGTGLQSLMGRHGQ